MKRKLSNIAHCLSALILVCIVLFSCKSHHDTTNYSPLTYDGIDVSRHQGEIKWRKVAKNKNIQYVYIKATEGSTYVDPLYKHNRKKAHKKGIKVGAYHFLTSSSSIKTQIDNFCRTVKKRKQDIIPMIDVEPGGIKGRWSKATLQKNVALMAKTLEYIYGKKPIIYTSMGFYNEYLSPTFDNYPLMIARYSSKRPVLNGNTGYTIWQYSENGRVKGINGTVDLSRFSTNRSLKSIKRK